ncbi:unnamed protein product [Polarella glacialis]|uniref:Uncharacterized protein n=1 Tax=Polarella glacialis TaxID=89957 RepID=A0A813EC26_POLGL|nr:unnamed protein product [Polarella glacialis]
MVGLAAHSKKRRCREIVFTGRGAEVEGDVGLVGVPRTRLARLSMLSFVIGSGSDVEHHLLESLCGCWALAFQFRRPLFALFEQVCKFGPPEGGNSNTPTKLPRIVGQGLQLAGILRSASLANIRAQVVPELFAVDASPIAAGTVSSDAGQVVAEELFHRGDFGGVYTPLLNPISAVLRAKGWTVSGDEDDFACNQHGVQHCLQHSIERTINCGC